MVADVDEPNTASIRILEKLGMSRMGRRIADGRPILDYEILSVNAKGSGRA